MKSKILFFLAALAASISPATAGRGYVIPALSIADVSVNESAGLVTLTVTKTGKAKKPSALTYSTSNGTALSGSDYTGRTGSLSLGAGATTGTFTIPIINDTIHEGNENFTVTILATNNATVTDGSATVTIIDNDNDPVPTTQVCPDGSVIPIYNTCPPPPTPGDEGLPTLTEVTDHNYLDDLKLTGGTGVIPPGSGDTVGAYRQVCADGFFAYDDPVLFPGQPGKSHLHDFSGNRTTNSFSTFASLINQGESSCNQTGTGKSAQRSAYWITALLDGHGHAIAPDLNEVYYKSIANTSSDCGMPTGGGSGPVGICTEIPDGMKMVAGSKLVAGQYGPANYRTDAGRYVYFYCSGTGAVSTHEANLVDELAASPICPTLNVAIEFPDCWDGVHDWTTARTHVVYKVDYHVDGKFRCPLTNPYLITNVRILYQFTTDANFKDYHLSADMNDLTQPRGWSLHADVFIVWDSRVKHIMKVSCLDGLKNASGGDLCNGQQFIGGAQPIYNGALSWTNPNRLQAIPPNPYGMTAQ